MFSAGCGSLSADTESASASAAWASARNLPILPGCSEACAGPLVLAGSGSDVDLGADVGVVSSVRSAQVGAVGFGAAATASAFGSAVCVTGVGAAGPGATGGS